MDIFAEFAVDEKLLETGVWRVVHSKTHTEPVEEKDIGERTAILVASSDNPKFRRLVDKKMKPHLLRHGMDVDIEIRERCTAEAISEILILDWRNWKIKEEIVPYSRQQVVDYLTKPQWVRLRTFFLALIGDEELFNAVREEAVVKNS